MNQTDLQNTCVHVHRDTIEQALPKIPDIKTIYKVSELFKVFGDSTRAVILSALAVSEMCVYDICEIAQMNKSAVSHQLRVLRENNLVKFRKVGKTVIYSLADSHVVSILNQALEHVNE